MAESRSLYSVIPARVRDDRELRPNAKLLYGELSALAQAEGYCWASNAYLAELFDLAPKTVEALLRQLKERGHIQIEVERDPDTNEFIRRKIWICGPPGTAVTPSPQNRGDPPLKNEGENNINIIINNKEPPYNPPAGDTPAVKKKNKSIPKYRPDLFERFWKKYPPREGRRDHRPKAVAAWDKLKPSIELCRKMSAELDPENWPESWHRDDGRYIPLPSTWLSQELWNVERVAPVNQRAAPMERPRARRFHVEVIDGEEVNVYDE